LPAGLSGPIERKTRVCATDWDRPRSLFFQGIAQAVEGALVALAHGVVAEAQTVGDLALAFPHHHDRDDDAGIAADEAGQDPADDIRLGIRIDAGRNIEEGGWRPGVGAEIIRFRHFPAQCGLSPPPAQTIPDVALDIGQQGGRDPMDAAEVGPVNLHGEAAGHLGNEFGGISPEMAPQPPVQGIESGPQRQPHHRGRGIFAVTTLRGAHQNRQDAVFVVRIGIAPVQEIEHGTGIGETCQTGMRPLQVQVLPAG